MQFYWHFNSVSENVQTCKIEPISRTWYNRMACKSRAKNFWLPAASGYWSSKYIFWATEQLLESLVEEQCDYQPPFYSYSEYRIFVLSLIIHSSLSGWSGFWIVSTHKLIISVGDLIGLASLHGKGASRDNESPGQHLANCDCKSLQIRTPWMQPGWLF